MTPRSEPVEAYLDELLGRLHGAPVEVRRMLSETETHLYAAVDDGLSRGLDEATAGEQAVARFGPVEQVAQEWNAHAPAQSLFAFGRRLAADLMPIVAIGLVAIGISGLLARAMTAVWGLRFMFADRPGTQYTPGECRYWLSIHPHAPNCTSAYLAESLADGTQARYAAGIIGLALLTVIAVTRRRRGIPLLTPPSLLTAFTGTTLFTAAAIVLCAVAIDDLRVSDGNGAGQWLSATVVALPLGLLYGRQFLKLGRRTPVAVY